MATNKLNMDPNTVDSKKIAQDKMNKEVASCCHPHSGALPNMPPLGKVCGSCPPCPASCNPNAPLTQLFTLLSDTRAPAWLRPNATGITPRFEEQTPAEKDVKKLGLQLLQTENNFKTKVVECSELRSELLKKKEELEKERCLHREVQNKLRQLEMKFEGLKAHTNMMLGTKEQALENELNVRTLKRCYRESRDEIAQLRVLAKEKDDQLQDYRAKYLQASQLAEAQKKQLELMELDNNRISEQINLEVQRVKLKFQEKLQELAPVPDMLKATQLKLKDAQQSQAIAEHNAEQFARELNYAREKINILLHNTIKPDKTAQNQTSDDKQVTTLTTRIAQLTDQNSVLKAEIDRLKINVFKAEDLAITNEKRLREKMNECVQLGSELDKLRTEAAIQIARTDEHLEVHRRCLQTTIAELERQLASTRGRLRISEREREEIQARMNCQIARLKENVEQAQLRILGLSTQVAVLNPGKGGQSEDPAAGGGECVCKSTFKNP